MSEKSEAPAGRFSEEQNRAIDKELGNLWGHLVNADSLLQSLESTLRSHGSEDTAEDLKTARNDLKKVVNRIGSYI